MKSIKIKLSHLYLNILTFQFICRLYTHKRLDTHELNTLGWVLLYNIWFNRPDSRYRYNRLVLFLSVSFNSNYGLTCQGIFVKTSAKLRGGNWKIFDLSVLKRNKFTYKDLHFYQGTFKYLITQRTVQTLKSLLLNLWWA